MILNILKPIMIFMTRYLLNYILPCSLRSFCSKHSKVILLTISSITFLSINSCEEAPSLIGTRLLPETDFVDIASTDTISVFSYTAYEDSIESDNPGTSYLGTIYDPYFGITRAEVVTQLRLREEWDDQPFVIDSVKLNLGLFGTSGDVTGKHFIRFQEIGEQLFIDTSYYSNKEIPLIEPLYEIELPTLKIDTATYVEVFIPNEFGEYLMRDTSMLFHDNSRPDFRAYFKGLKLSLRSEGDPIFTNISLAPPSSGYFNFITIFYTTSGTPGQYYFLLDAMSKNARYNIYEHDFTAAAPDKRIEHINQPVRDTLSYLQGLNGVFTRILLPGLETIKNDPSMENIAVNRARLIVPVYNDGQLYEGSKMASQLFIRYKPVNSTAKFYVPDYNPNNNFFDGKIDTVNNVVKFNIASYVQRYLEDKTNTLSPELEIFVATGSTKNAILKTSESATPVTFEFTYTKF